MTEERDPTPAEELADRIIELVLSTPAGGQRGDSARLFMASAHIHGFRRFVAIRDLAKNDAGAEAVILVRSLLSLTARAAYVDAPSDSAERKRRFLQDRALDLREEIKSIRRLTEAGFDVDPDTTAHIPDTPDPRS